MKLSADYKFAVKALFLMVFLMFITGIPQIPSGFMIAVIYLGLCLSAGAILILAITVFMYFQDDLEETKNDFVIATVYVRVNDHHLYAYCGTKNHKLMFVDENGERHTFPASEMNEHPPVRMTLQELDQLMNNFKNQSL